MFSQILCKVETILKIDIITNILQATQNSFSLIKSEMYLLLDSDSFFSKGYILLKKDFIFKIKVIFS